MTANVNVAVAVMSFIISPKHFAVMEAVIAQMLVDMQSIKHWWGIVATVTVNGLL